jgi:protein O-GlcNAc transferase
VSCDFRRHSVFYFIEPLLAQHDRRQVEVFCYSDVLTADEQTERIKRAADVWRDVAPLDDAQLAERVREDRIDVLVDLMGHARGGRLLAFARRPAPVQMTYLGYPNTTGVDAIGYRLTDEWVDPTGAADGWHTEKLVRLAHGFLCYRPDPDAPDVSESPALRNGFVTFGSFNNLAKVSVATMRLWGRILRDVPGSRLLLKYRSLGDEPTCAIVRQRMAQADVPVDRVDMVGPEPDHRTHLASYARVDVALDPFPYNGATTTCEALWMGAGVVTLAGIVHAGRVGVSILTRAGLGELVATDENAYFGIATNLARDIDQLARMRRQMRDRVSGSPLRDEPALARDVEAAYRKMWMEWCG